MTDIPDWKKAIDRGTSMHTILAEKKSAEGPDWMKTPEEEEMLWEVRKFAVETYGKTKWAQTESKQQMESISSVLDQMINQGMDLKKEEILKMIWEKIRPAQGWPSSVGIMVFWFLLWNYRFSTGFWVSRLLPVFFSHSICFRTP